MVMERAGGDKEGNLLMPIPAHAHPTDKFEPDNNDKDSRGSTHEVSKSEGKNALVVVVVVVMSRRTICGGSIDGRGGGGGG